MIHLIDHKLFNGRLIFLGFGLGLYYFCLCVLRMRFIWFIHSISFFSFLKNSWRNFAKMLHGCRLLHLWKLNSQNIVLLHQTLLFRTFRLSPCGSFFLRDKYSRFLFWNNLSHLLPPLMNTAIQIILFDNDLGLTRIIQLRNIFIFPWVRARILFFHLHEILLRLRILRHLSFNLIKQRVLLQFLALFY